MARLTQLTEVEIERLVKVAHDHLLPSEIVLVLGLVVREMNDPKMKLTENAYYYVELTKMAKKLERLKSKTPAPVGK